MLLDHFNDLFFGKSPLLHFWISLSQNYMGTPHHKWARWGDTVTPPKHLIELSVDI